MGDEAGLCEELMAQCREGVLDRLVGAGLAQGLFGEAQKSGRNEMVFFLHRHGGIY